MNNEIKEILDDLKNTGYEKLAKNIENIIDYITILQEENERLKKTKIFIDTQDIEERYGEELYKDYLEKQVKDYKSRIEKAVEYIKELISATKGTLNDMNYCDKKETITQYVESLEYDINHYEYLLNILNGKE